MPVPDSGALRADGPVFEAAGGGAEAPAEGATVGAAGATGATGAGNATGGADGADVAGALSGTARVGFGLTV